MFGREFQELVQGSKNDPAYHGQATLAKWPISESSSNPLLSTVEFLAAALVFTEDRSVSGKTWCKSCAGSRDQCRGSKLLIYNLHLESNDELRLSLIEETLSDAARQDPRRPVIMAGDFNLDASKGKASSAFAATGFLDAIAAPRPIASSVGAGKPNRLGLRSRTGASWAGPRP